MNNSFVERIQAIILEKFYYKTRCGNPVRVNFYRCPSCAKSKTKIPIRENSNRCLWFLSSRSGRTRNDVVPLNVYNSAERALFFDIIFNLLQKKNTKNIGL